MDKAQAAAFGNLPTPVMPPRAPNAKLMSCEVELLALDTMAGRTVAVGAIPYLPGITILMPGENIGPTEVPQLTFLRSIEDWGREFPGFEKIVAGEVVEDGKYRFWCVK
ncbi:MAG: hypothetical protein WCS31_08545 [Verrucomicrobiae bacterium]